jgi:hypothetical protein
MAKQIVSIGTVANDGTGDPIRTAFDKVNDNADELYAWTGWISRSDATPVTLGALTNNLIVITGTPESNNGLTLLDANSRITPIALGDAITVDFAFTVETPSGTDNYIEVGILVPAAGFFRNQTFPLLKGSGIDDFISVSWTLPVGATFLANGGDIVLVPNVAMDVKDLYINVCRVHKGQ